METPTFLMDEILTLVAMSLLQFTLISLPTPKLLLGNVEQKSTKTSFMNRLTSKVSRDPSKKIMAIGDIPYAVAAPN